MASCLRWCSNNGTNPDESLEASLSKFLGCAYAVGLDQALGFLVVVLFILLISAIAVSTFLITR